MYIAHVLYIVPWVHLLTFPLPIVHVCMYTSNKSLGVSGYALKSSASVTLPVLVAFMLSKLS